MAYDGGRLSNVANPLQASDQIFFTEVTQIAPKLVVVGATIAAMRRADDVNRAPHVLRRIVYEEVRKFVRVRMPPWSARHERVDVIVSLAHLGFRHLAR